MSFDLTRIAAQPFRYREDFLRWATTLPLENKSVEFIEQLFKSIAGDMARGEFETAIVSSPEIAKNPEKFLALIGNTTNPDLLWLQGRISAKYQIMTVSDLGDDVALTAYIAQEISEGKELSENQERELERLWREHKPELMPSLIMQVLKLAEIKDMSEYLFSTPDQYLPFLFRWMTPRNIPVRPIVDLFWRALNLNADTLDEAWEVLYFREVDQPLLVEYFVQSLKKYSILDIRHVEWVLEDKMKKDSSLGHALLDRRAELDRFHQQLLWELVAKAAPTVAVARAVELTKIPWDSSLVSWAGYLFNVIKQKLYKQDVLFGANLYIILYDWLHDKPFFEIQKFTLEELLKMPSNFVLGKVHEVVERLMSGKIDFDAEKVMAALDTKPYIKCLLESRVVVFLEQKEYNPIIDILEMASVQANRGQAWARQALDTMEYYFEHFPTVMNHKYPSVDDRKRAMVNDALSDLDAFLSQARVFARLHQAGMITVCEPSIGGRHPEYLLNVNGKTAVAEVKNYHTSEDLRLSSFGSAMMQKFSSDIESAFKQVVPLHGKQLPALLLLDRSRSMVDELMVENVFEGSAAVRFYPDHPEIPAHAIRENDSLGERKELAKFIQGIVLFQPNSAAGLSGKLFPHRRRDMQLSDDELIRVSEALFGKSSE